MSYRIDRLNSEMRKVIADVIDNKIKDPRVTEMVSVSRVEVAKDLKILPRFTSRCTATRTKSTRLSTELCVQADLSARNSASLSAIFVRFPNFGL